MDPNVIKVNPALVDSFVAQIKQTAGQLAGHLEELNGNLNKIMWTGADQEQFQVAKNDWNRASSDMNELLGRIGGGVNDVNVAYRGVETTNAKMFMA